MSVYDLEHDELPKSDIPEITLRLTEAVDALEEMDDDFSRQEIYERREYVKEIVNDVKDDLKAIEAVLRRMTY